MPTRYYERGALKSGNRLVGPAIVTQYDSTTVIPPGLTAHVDRFGNIVIAIAEAARRGARDDRDGGGGMSVVDYEVGRQPGPPTRDRVEVDPITLRVLGGAFHAIAKEMAGVLFRMSYCSIIRESEDLGAGIFDAEGRELCESDSTPMHIGSLPWYIRGFLHRLGDDVEEGDVIVHNHPYLGASHSPDVAVAVPIFADGELLGLAAVTAHVLDVGGSFPGINADAFDVYAEAKLYNGLRWYRRGELNVDVDRMIFDNVRTETMNRGDMNAMLAACQLGRDRFLRLVDRYGVEVVMSAAYDWMDYSERMLRAEIAKIPDGTYGPIVGWLDDDARNRGTRLRVETRVVVEGDEVTIDLTGSHPEVPTGYNVPFEGSLLVSCYYAIRTILLDETTFPEHVPQNDGVFRPVKVIAPKGTIFNPTFPRACFSRFCQTQRVVDNVILALSDALPDKTTAGNSAGIHFCAYAGFDDAAGEYWLYLEVNEGSYGGRSREGRDGLRRQPDGEHAQQPDRGARPALPDALRPVRAAAGAGGAGQVARRDRDHPPQPLPRRRHLLVRGRPADRSAEGRVRRLGRPRRVVPQEPGHGRRRSCCRRRSRASRSRPASSSSSASRTRPATATRSSGRPSRCARTCSTTSRRSSSPATRTGSSSPTSGRSRSTRRPRRRSEPSCGPDARSAR